MPIGRPIANTGSTCSTPAGAGAGRRARRAATSAACGLGRGYLARPGLTAERFVPDPFASEPGGRLYRTGDLARWRPDGPIEYLGRIDHQVKIRGFRVELGEIEAALAAHPGVAQATVVARDDGPGGQRLVAYLVPVPGTRPQAPDLRAALGRSLPEYMVPSAFVTLEAMPLTPNGKLDRKALPAPVGDDDRETEFSNFVPPRGPVEQALAESWAELLGGGPIGAHDNFFDRGGHSLMALQVLARARHLFDVEVPLKDFLEQPTLARLAALVEQSLATGLGGTQAPPIVRADRSGPLVASFAQQRLWFLDQLEPGSAAYNIPTAVQLDGRLDVEALRRALEEVVRRHEVLRTTFASNGGIPTQVHRRVARITAADPGPLRDSRGAAARAGRAARADGGGARLRPGPRTPRPRRAHPARRGPPRRPGDDAPHRLRRLVARRPDPRGLGALRRLRCAASPRRWPSRPSSTPTSPPGSANWLQDDVLEQQLGYWTRQLAGLRTAGSPDRSIPSPGPQRARRRTVCRRIR